MITVLGGSGFIGRHLISRLDQLNIEAYVPARDEDLSRRHLGAVIYCIGVTADFRSRPAATVEAHVCKLLDVLRQSNLDSLLYLSSTRVYDKSASTEENALLCVQSQNASDVYNLSKLMGESIALNCGVPTRVARIANVYGDDFDSPNFLSSIIRDAVTTGVATIGVSGASVKDYVSIADVVDALIKIAGAGHERVYNIGSGVNVSNLELMSALQNLTHCAVNIPPDGPTIGFPPIDIGRLKGEFAFQPGLVLEELPALVDSYRSHFGIAK